MLAMLTFMHCLENEIDIVISHLNFNSRHHDKCKCALKLILLGMTSNLFSLKNANKNANIVNYVYYGKNSIRGGLHAP